MAFNRRWLLVLFALILSGGPLSAASTKEQRAYATAVAVFHDEMWSRAETEFGQFVVKYKESTNAPMALLLEAQAQFKQGKFTTAIALLADTNHLAKAGTLADQYVYWIGEGRFQNHDFDGAAQTFVSLAKNYPESPLRLRSVVEAAAARAQLGQWLQTAQLLEETNGVFQRAAQMDPANELVSRGQLLFAQAKIAQNEFDAAAKILSALNPQTLPPHLEWRRAYMLCQTEFAAGDTNAALAAATNLVQIAGLASDYNLRAESVSVRADILEKSGRVADAEAAYQENLTTNAPGDHQRQAVLKIAELAAAQNQFSDAETNLDKFTVLFTNSPARAIALLTLGELHLKDHAAQPAETNHLQSAQAKFNQFLGTFTNSATAGLADKAHLDRGWCEWLSKDTTNRLAGLTNSLTDFEAAAQSANLPPEDLAVARFKTGDAQFALTNYAAALENYRVVLEDFTNFPALGAPALYQSLRANLQLTNYEGASNALAQILKQYPANDLATNSALLYGEGLAAADRPAEARQQFQNFVTMFPDSLLCPQAEFAIARTYELEQIWPAAITTYQDWLKDFPTNDMRQQADYALAWVNFQAGDTTNAFGLFTNFVAQFPVSDLAPRAQWWLADYFFNQADYVNAEKNYELVYQNHQAKDLAYRALMMAGRAAVARQDYNGAINNYFIKLEGDTNCLVDLRVQAAFAHGSALMKMDSTFTNDPLHNFSEATNVFIQICQVYPTNEPGARAWIEIGKCTLQFTNYDNYEAASNAYAQVLNSNMQANISLRSQAQIGIGIALEKMADLASGASQSELLDEAWENYRDVFYKLNLRDGEEPDPFWQEEAGLRAALLVGRLNDVKSEKLFYNSLKAALPQLSNLIDKKIAALPPETK